MKPNFTVQRLIVESTETKRCAMYNLLLWKSDELYNNI